MASQRKQWFVAGDEIEREVITADIQRYLGPDALVTPGQQNGLPGFWTTAQRPLTAQMLQDLQADSKSWRKVEHQGQDAPTREEPESPARATHYMEPYHDEIIISHSRRETTTEPESPILEEPSLHDTQSHFSDVHDLARPKARVASKGDLEVAARSLKWITHAEYASKVSLDTEITPTQDSFWDRFELAAAVERFLRQHLTDEIVGTLLPEYLALADEHHNPSIPGASSSSENTTSDRRGTSSRKRTGQWKSFSKGKRALSRGDEDSDSDEDPPHKRMTKSTIARGRGLRCPFHCHDPDQYCQQACSSALGFPNMTRLVQHLKRVHWQKSVAKCPRCRDVFESNQQLEGHLNADERCPKREEAKDDRISLDQWQEIIENRPEGYSDLSEGEKWQHVYKALFPGDNRIPSAYARPIMIDQLHDPLAASIEEVLADQWGSFVCETFHNLISDLKSKMPMILQKAQEKVDSRSGFATAAGTAVVPTVILSSEDKGKGIATGDMTQPAHYEAQRSSPSLSNTSTSGSSKQQSSEEAETEDLSDPQRIWNEDNNLPFTYDDIIDPQTLGLTESDMDFPDSDLPWNDEFKSPLFNPALFGGDTMDANFWELK